MRLQTVEYFWGLCAELSTKLNTSSVCASTGERQPFPPCCLVTMTTLGTSNKKKENTSQHFMVSKRKNYNLISYSGWIKNDSLPEQINREFSLACNQCHQVAVPLLRLCLCRLEWKESRQDCYNKGRSDRYAWLHTSGAYHLVSSNMAETSTIKMDDFPRNLHWDMGFSIATFDYWRDCSN